MALTMPSGFSLRSLQRKYGLLQYMTGLNLYMQFPMSASFPLITVCNGLTSTSSGVLKRIDIAELTLENIMVTADTAVPFCPDFFPAILYGGKPLVAVYSIVEEYEITGNVLLFRTFAS